MTQKTRVRLLFLMIVVLLILSSFFIVPKDFSFKVFRWQVNVIASADKTLNFYPAIKKDNDKLNITFKKRYNLGCDLQGGTELLYQADLKDIAQGKESEAMGGVRDVIERRVNLFGVAEPKIRIEDKDRLQVDLCGVKDVDQAIKMIGETPSLEFKTETSREEFAAIYKQQTGQDLPAEAQGPFFNTPTGLTGKDLVRGEVDFDPTTGAPIVSLEFNDNGKKLFAEITEKNVGQRIAIVLDGAIVTAPTVDEPIRDGKAIISGKFTIEEAKTIAKRLNAGALPVPIKIIKERTIGATLGQDSLAKSLKAGFYGFLLIALFMILYYRLPGLIASIALVIYTSIVLMIFNMIPGFTLTLSGIAGLILSVGMAVDANVLIFERMREELASGRSFQVAIEDGFNRAWPSIRDSNLTTLITAFALFEFGDKWMQGFAVALSVGIFVSMFSALMVTKNFLLLILTQRLEKYKQLF